MASGRWARGASCGALALLLLAGCATRTAQTPKPAAMPAAKALELTDVQVGGEGDAVEVTAVTSAKAVYSLVRQAQPPRLSLELAGARIAGEQKTIAVNRGAVSSVKTIVNGANSGVEIFLSGEAAYTVEGRGTNVVVSVTPKAPAEPAPEAAKPAEAPLAAAPAPPPPPPEPTPAPAPEPPAAPPVELAPARNLTGIEVEKQPEGLVVNLHGDGALTYEYFLVEGKSLVVDVFGVGNKVRPMKQKVGDAWVSRIRLGVHEQPRKATRVVFDLVKVGEYRVEGAGDRVVVSFGAPALAPPTRAAAAATRVEAKAEPVAAAAVEAKSAAPAAVAAPVEPGASAPAQAQAPTASAPIPPPPGALPALPVYTGRKLSLDFKDADVNDILRLISEVSGLNFVAGPEVKGTVTIKLADVPWDQALDIILKTNVPQLAQVRESDNIVRITTADKILDEEQRRRRIEEDKKKTLDAQQALQPLVTKSYAISYAKAKDIKEFIANSFSSERGKALLQYDERTNTLVVQDLKEKVEEIDRVIKSLDTPTPAVLVEARIVEVQSNFGQSIGVQWNAVGVKDAAHGNATSFAFPNSVSVGGAANTGSVGAGNYMVNLPAAAATGGIGMSFGHIANTLSLDLRLSAGESMGKVKVLSNPRVLVVQNQKAVINLGSQLPIPKTDATGNRTVEWKDVGITLDVTPQITNDKRVFMDIKVEKSSQGENVQTTEGTMFSINTSRAQSKVLIADGETTVIGGIFIQENNDSDQSIPGIGKVPVLGWLFKSKSKEERKRELMIFLTPRLVVM